MTMCGNVINLKEDRGFDEMVVAGRRCQYWSLTDGEHTYRMSKGNAKDGLSGPLPLQKDKCRGLIKRNP